MGNFHGGVCHIGDGARLNFITERIECLQPYGHKPNNKVLIKDQSNKIKIYYVIFLQIQSKIVILE